MAIGKLPDSSDELGDDGGDSIFAEINITPLTDVFLVMMIIFMLSALAVQVERQHEKKINSEQAEIDKRSGIKVNLPSGPAMEIDPSQKSLVLLIPITGPVNVGGKSLEDSDLDNLFRAAFARDKMTQVVLKADKGVQHGRVVNIMERAKTAGLTRLAIGTSGGS